MQHVVQTPIVPCPFQRGQVARLLHHADDGGIAARVRTENAEVPFGQVEALPAGVDVFLDAAQGVGQGQHLPAVGCQQVVRQPFRRLGPDPRQLAELFYQLTNSPAELASHNAPLAVPESWVFYLYAPGSCIPGKPKPVGSPKAEVIFAVSSAVYCLALSSA